MKRRNNTLDLFKPSAASLRPRMVDAKTPLAEWKGPGTEPHSYSPDYQAAGDCRTCGHIYSAHLLPDVDGGAH